MGRASPRLIAITTASLAAASVCLGAPVPIMSDTGNSTEGIGAFTGSIDYTPTGGNTGSLLISLTNTSPAANGGFLTAFVFNINSSDAGASVALISGPANFAGISSVSAAPFGSNFDSGASATNGQFLGGGNPNNGLAVGVTGLFTFAVTASDAAGLTATDFFSEGPFEFNFVARFRGFEDNGSDKVPAGNGPVIPLPTTAAMGGAGLLCIGLRRRR